jgi:DNA-binding CsgD family transcriptional regulator
MAGSWWDCFQAKRKTSPIQRTVLTLIRGFERPISGKIPRVPQGLPMYLSGTQTRLMSQIMQVLAEPHQEHEIRQQVGELIMQLMQAQFYASFVWNADSNAFMDTVQINMDPSNIADYEAYYQFNDPITHTMQRYQVAVKASDVLPQRELMNTEFFNDFLAKDGLHWGVNLYAWHKGHNIGDMRIWRDKRRDNFSEDEMRLLDMILPAFTASLSRARAMDKPSSVLTNTNLSPRELQVAQSASLGLGDKEIARQLGISPATVRTHMDNAFKKLGINNRSVLARTLGLH